MKLLLAEDNPGISRATKVILTRSGFEVDTAADGPQTLERLHSDDYDGLVLDWMLPGMSGLDVLRQIRAEGNALPTIMMTAKGEVADKVEGLDAGANDYITKPYDASELVARVRAMIRSQRHGASPAVHIDGVTFNRETLEMSSSTGSLRIGLKELEMAEMLVHAGGNAIPVARLSERIWDGKADASTVALYVSYLNKKLQSLHSTALVRGDAECGYWLESGAEGAEGAAEGDGR